MAVRKRSGSAVARRESVRVSMRLDSEAYRALQLHGMMEDAQPGVLVSRLITEHLNRFHVRCNPRHSNDRPESADLVNIPALDGPALA